MISSLIIDSREPDWVKALSFYGAKKIVLEMEYGDIWATCDDGQTLVIERKEPEDFIGSMTSNRLIRQINGLAQLRAGGIWPYLMIMGEILPGPHGKIFVNGKTRNINYAAVQGELLSIQELGVFIYNALSSRDLEEAVLRLSNRSRTALMTIPPAKRQGTTLSRPADFISGLPGVGASMADAIVMNTGTAAKALEYLTNRREIPNVQVGAKRREKIRGCLGLKDNEILKIERKEK